MRCWLHMLLLTRAANESDREGVILAIKYGLEDVGMPPTGNAQYTKEFKIMAAQAYVIYLGRPDLARKLLPSHIGLPTETAVTRHLVLAQIIGRERGVAAGRKVIAAAEATMQKLPKRLRDARALELKFANDAMDLWQMMTPTDEKIFDAWCKHLRPREWDRDSVMELGNGEVSDKMWGFRTLARLTYWSDVGDLAQMDAVVQDVESREVNSDLRPAQQR